MRTLRLCLLFLVGLGASESLRAEGQFRVGCATAEITPPVGWRRAGGFSEVVSTGIHDPLYAKALVLSQEGITFALVGNDLCSVPRELTDAARRQASQKTGIPVANIIIAATHTHGGPEYYGPLRDALHARAMRENNRRDPHEPIDYQALLVKRWVDLIVRAYSTRRTASLSIVVPQQRGVAFNRRFLMKDGSIGWNPGKLNPNIFRPAGPTDPDLPLILAKDAQSGKPFVSLTVFAMHTAMPKEATRIRNESARSWPRRSRRRCPCRARSPAGS